MDLDGRYAEAPFEAASLAIGTVSLYTNLRDDNYLSALVDVGGLGLDAIGVLIPAFPGVASAAIAASRQAANGVFPNQLAGNLADELVTASSVGAKALRFGDEGFEAAVNSGTVKFVVTESGELLISPHTVKGVEISHAVLSNGQADIAGSSGSFFGIRINNHSGHFRPSDDSLNIARDAFGRHGVIFQD